MTEDHIIYGATLSLGDSFQYDVSISVFSILNLFGETKATSSMDRIAPFICFSIMIFYIQFIFFLNF